MPLQRLAISAAAPVLRIVTIGRRIAILLVVTSCQWTGFPDRLCVYIYNSVTVLR